MRRKPAEKPTDPRLARAWEAGEQAVRERKQFWTDCPYEDHERRDAWRHGYMAEAVNHDPI
jgi:hypothetical protein